MNLDTGQLFQGRRVYLVSREDAERKTVAAWFVHGRTWERMKLTSREPEIEYTGMVPSQWR